MDKFHEQEENIYQILHDNTCAFSSPFADYVKEHVAEIKAYTRIKLLKLPYSFLKLEKKSINSSDNHISLFLDEVECMDKTRL